jgi:hypothetical protein
LLRRYLLLGSGVGHFEFLESWLNGSEFKLAYYSEGSVTSFV